MLSVPVHSRTTLTSSSPVPGTRHCCCMTWQLEAIGMHTSVVIIIMVVLNYDVPMLYTMQTHIIIQFSILEILGIDRDLSPG